MCQIRTSNIRRFKATFDGVTYRIDLTDICSICNSNSIQSFQHVFFECVPLRQGLTLDTEIVSNCENLLYFLNDISKDNVKAVVHYFLNILRLRSFILNE
ncbi:hypothetical protein PPYR_12838 [Photinus pyralis]|uniref:Reverse transcriptase zinc-binding domain-containing protein n=1 Tax=Photinus pyralis TaxID=7054 RepID=A0A5N4A7I3_PHOPY|nr:hypothetical protein PPYR_12838 [Photinus pyralis]